MILILSSALVKTPSDPSPGAMAAILRQSLLEFPCSTVMLQAFMSIPERKIEYLPFELSLMTNFVAPAEGVRSPF